MGNASSKQKITQPQLDASSSRLRRTWIWDRFQELVQKLKNSVGFGRKPITVSRAESVPTVQQDTESPAPSNRPGGETGSQRSDTFSEGQVKNHQSDILSQQANAQETIEQDTPGENDSRASGDARPSASLEASKNSESNSDSRLRKDETLAEYGREFDAREVTEDDLLVQNITTALGIAAPMPAANLGADNQLNLSGPAAVGLENTKPVSVPCAKKDGKNPNAESPSAFSIRETYESRVEELDAVYSRIVPESERPPKLKANKGATLDDYDNQVVEYVSSSLMVALPQPHYPSSGTRSAFQTLVYNKFVNTAIDTNAESKSVGSPVNTTVPIPDEGPFEPEVEAILVNYRTWDRRLYSELSLDQFSIRLVGILPGLPGDEVSVSLDVQSLNEVSMQYEALSYVWGNPEPAKNITINNVEVQINPNLYDALISLRHHDSTRHIWIDAICLNQTSLAEKSKEVQKMSQIYSQAKTVNVFLGAPAPNNLTFINNFFSFLNRDDQGQAAGRYAEEGLSGLDKICEKYQIDLRDVCKGFMEACLQPWWGRIWTLQEFYLAREEPMWYWGRAHASNASLKRDFSLLVSLSHDLFTSEDANGRGLSDLKTRLAKPIGFYKVDIERISTLISRRYRTDGFDIPRRLYRELTARATNPRDFVYGLRAIFDPVFRRVFVPDYQMATELLFACLAIFLIQFECWGDVLWWYPSRYEAGKGLFPSWLPNFTQHIVPHEFDVQPRDQATVEKPDPKLVVLNHRLHAQGYNLDKVYAHRHIDKNDGEKIFQELWQFDHCMNHNHECHKYFVMGATPEDPWLKVFLDMYGSYYDKLTYFNSAFRGALIQSTMQLEDGDKLPQQVAECIPCWDLLQWHALRIATPGLPEALNLSVNNAGTGYLENIFSPRMETVFRKAFANFFIGACLFDWNHISVWLNRFPNGTQWSKENKRYWSEIHESLSGDTEKRVKAIADAYDGYQVEIHPEVMRVSWCYSFYYTFLAYVILLDCDDHASLASMILKLRTAGDKLRSIYFSTTATQIKELASVVPSVATRVSHYNTVLDLFRGRYLLWTHGGFRGISCPGVEACCDNKSIVAVVDGLSFPVIVREFNEETGEGLLAGCVLLRGVDMLNGDTEKMALPPDYKRGEKRIFKFR